MTDAKRKGRVGGGKQSGENPGPEPGLSEARRRIAHLLKRQGPVTAASLAQTLGLTKVAVRQHLQGLEALGLARSQPQAPQGRGRPSRAWTLTDSALSLFPDRHGELTVGILDAVRGAFGNKGIQKILHQRAKQQVAHYRSLMPSPKASLLQRVKALASLRSEEGYLAEVLQEKPGCYLLIEHHCPICEAAQSCLGLCETELEVFQQVLGEDARVERTDHLLSGAGRCVYRVQKK